MAGVFFDDDAGAGTQVGSDERVGAARIARDRVDTGVEQTPRDRPAVDNEFDLEAGQQDLAEHPDDQLVLTDGETPHRIINRQLYARNEAPPQTAKRRTRAEMAASLRANLLQSQRQGL